MKRIAFAAVVAAFGLAPVSFPATAADNATYESAKVCAKCHDQEGDSWATTVHAKAFDLLKPQVRPDAKIKAKLDPAKDYTQDTVCLSCHTTGYGEPGGYSPAMPPVQAKALAGVGCESCHGAGSEYKKEHGDAETKFKRGGEATRRMDIVKAGQNFDYEKACLKCHNAPASPFNALLDPKYAFDFAAAVHSSGKGKAIHDHFKLMGVFSGDPIPALREELQKNAIESGQ